MKKIYILLFCFAQAINIFPQSVEQIKADSKTYLWGEGSGTTLKKAEQQAVAMLLGQLAPHVKGKFTLLLSEINESDKENKSDEKLKAIINTYSREALNSSDKIIIGNEPEAEVFLYIKLRETDKIFSERKNKIKEFVGSGTEALNLNQIADALRYYYWAYTLLRSHPEGSSISVASENGKQDQLATWLPLRINSIFTGITIRTEDLKNAGDASNINLVICYHNSPVSNFDYSIWNGSGWSGIISAKDGLGFIDLSGSSTDLSKIKIKAEYLFEEEASADNELREVMLNLDPVPFRNSSIAITNDTVSVSEKPVLTAANDVQVEGAVWQSRSVNLVPEEEQGPYNKTMMRVTESVKSQNYSAILNDFTPDGLKMFQELIKYGKASILNSTFDFKYVRFGKTVICRSLPMSFKFTNNYKQFVEDVVFHFDSTGKISNLSFGLGTDALKNILYRETWTEQVKLVLITFLESYKTAYALKHLSYIESIFSDDALIIVGSVLKTSRDVSKLYSDNKIIRYNRYTKTEYLKNLKLCFLSNEFINLKFEDSEIRKSGKGGELYGIQIKQNYSSTNYGDTGYLFLMVDLNNSDLPVIHVRTWQPEKNPDGSIYGLGDFN